MLSKNYSSFPRFDWSSFKNAAFLSLILTCKFSYFYFIDSNCKILFLLVWVLRVDKTGSERYFYGLLALSYYDEAFPIGYLGFTLS